MSGELRYERVGAAAVLTIDRPERRNAIDDAAAEAFRQGLVDFESDDDARVLVLTGAGGQAFCAGADLKAMDLDVDHPHGPMGPTRLTPAKPAIAAAQSPWRYWTTPSVFQTIPLAGSSSVAFRALSSASAQLRRLGTSDVARCHARLFCTMASCGASSLALVRSASAWSC